jgi:hypothetical protein
VWQSGGRHHVAELQAAQRGAAIGETYKLPGYCMVTLMVSTTLTKSATFVLVAALPFSAPPRAEILTRCTASEVFSCCFPVPMIPKDQDGRTGDGISEGAISSIDKEDELDIIFKDPSDIRSVAVDGPEFLTLPRGDAFLVVAIDTRTPVLEHYFFKLDNSGGETVVWAPLARGLVSSRRSSLMTARWQTP